jgi:hypothetical protein
MLNIAVHSVLVNTPAFKHVPFAVALEGNDVKGSIPKHIKVLEDAVIGVRAHIQHIFIASVNYGPMKNRVLTLVGFHGVAPVHPSVCVGLKRANVYRFFLHFFV